MNQNVIMKDAESIAFIQKNENFDDILKKLALSKTELSEESYDAIASGIDFKILRECHINDMINAFDENRFCSAHILIRSIENYEFTGLLGFEPKFEFIPYEDNQAFDLREKRLDTQSRILIEALYAY